MPHTPFSWRCPACSDPLQQNNKQWSCTNNHRFDCAKEGYVNLLLAQHKNSKAPGDSKEMVNARRAFLSEGHYSPLADCLSNTLQKHLLSGEIDSSVNSLSVFDAGCGEGYYLNAITQYLGKKCSSIIGAGVDIAKPAVAKAAKQNKNLHFAVASTFSLPLQDMTQDAVVQVFAPSSDKEVHRVLKTGGLWMQVNPAGDHLMDLKKQVYDKPQTHSVNNEIPENFELVEQTEIAFGMNLQNKDARTNLLMMTPYYWTISADKKEVLLEALTSVKAHFDIKVFRAN